MILKALFKSICSWFTQQPDVRQKIDKVKSILSIFDIIHILMYELDMGMSEVEIFLTIYQSNTPITDLQLKNRMQHISNAHVSKILRYLARDGYLRLVEKDKDGVYHFIVDEEWNDKVNDILEEWDLIE